MKKLILDFDGTIVSIKRRAEAYRKSLIYSLAEKTGLDIKYVEKDLNRAKRKVLKNPAEYGWVVNGYVSAFGDEDPYIVYTSSALLLYKSNDIYRFCSHDEFNNFLNSVFSNSVGNMPYKISNRDKKVLEKLKNVADITIVSNSKSSRIEKALDEAGLDIEVIGDAKKMFVDENFDKINRYLDVDGLKIELRRPYYYNTLNRIGGEIVVGDVFSFDLALPYYLGMEIVLKENYYTPRWSKNFVNSKGKVIRRLDELLGFI